VQGCLPDKGRKNISSVGATTAGDRNKDIGKGAWRFEAMNAATSPTSFIVGILLRRLLPLPRAFRDVLADHLLKIRTVRRSGRSQANDSHIVRADLGGETTPKTLDKVAGRSKSADIGGSFGRARRDGHQDTGALLHPYPGSSAGRQEWRFCGFLYVVKEILEWHRCQWRPLNVFHADGVEENVEGARRRAISAKC
jgi:hypothetical protein